MNPLIYYYKLLNKICFKKIIFKKLHKKENQMIYHIFRLTKKFQKLMAY